MDVPLPPLEEQRRIAQTLDAADALRTKARHVLARLESLIESVFEDLFGEPVSNPLGWPMRTVGEVATAQGGLQVAATRASNPIETPNLDEVKPMRVTAAELARCALQPGDLLVVEGHGNTDEIGRAALWDGSVPGCVHQNHLIRARFDPEQVLPIYGASYVNSRGGRRHLLRSAKTTSGLNTITVSDVRRTPIAVPPLKKQRAFAERVAATEKQQDRQQAQLRHLDTLFASLQSRAFSGEL
jgi:type I restriction enzyme S subunit